MISKSFHLDSWVFPWVSYTCPTKFHIHLCCFYFFPLKYAASEPSQAFSLHRSDHLTHVCKIFHWLLMPLRIPSSLLALAIKDVDGSTLGATHLLIHATRVLVHFSVFTLYVFLSSNMLSLFPPQALASTGLWMECFFFWCVHFCIFFIIQVIVQM